MKRPANSNGDGTRPRRESKPDPREVGFDELQMLNEGECPTCGNRGFVLGPRGGLNLNIECADVECRSRYNVTLFAGAIQHAHRIEKRSEGGLRWPSEPK